MRGRALCAALALGVAIGRSIPAEDDVIHANNRGTAMMEQYKHAQAVEEFRKVTKGAPSWAPGFVNLGLAALYARDMTAAREAFVEAVRLDPSLPQGHYGLGLVEKNEGNTDEAIVALEKSRVLVPDDPDVLYNLGLLHARRREFEPAVTLLAKARALDPNSVSVRYQLARALLQSGKVDEGNREMAAYQKLAANPKFAVPTGNQYGEAGRLALVITDYRALAAPGPATAPVAVRFSDATAASGISFRHAGPGGEPGRAAAAAKGSGADAEAARYGSGLAIADFDGDGRPDLVLVNASAAKTAATALYRNAGDLKFEDVTKSSGVDFKGIGMAAVLGDFDNDGDADLYLTRLGGGALYANDGKGHFTDVTKRSGAAASGFLLGAAWADVDHDGDLDLFLDRIPAPGTRGPAAPILMLNRGDGTFKPAGDDLKIAAPAGGSVAAVFADFDGDRDIDAVVSSLRGQDTLLDNRRDSGFKALGRETGLSARGAGRGLAAGDLNGDGLPDLVFAGGPDAPLRLFLNTGRQSFTETPIPAPPKASLLGVALLDADNDGDLDVFAAGSTLVLLLNDGQGRFRDVSSEAGLADLAAKDARGVAVADLDGDGDLDVVVTRNGGPPIVLRNETAGANRWLEIALRGLNSNKDGIGTKVEVQAGPAWQRREVQAGGGYLSQSPPSAHFGLGSKPLADIVRLLWPGGVLQAELDVPAGQRVEENELDRKGSSCPLLFAWNGARYGFLTDILGVGGLGMWTAPDVYAKPSPEEYLKIEPDQLQPRDGAYLLQMLENLEEVTYLDEAKLIALDHPKEIDVYPLGAFGGRDAGPLRKLAVERSARVYALRAIDHNDRDVTGALQKIDRTYADNFRLDRLAGYAEMHNLTLEFPEAVTRMKRPALFLYGWVDFEYSSSNYAAYQAGVRLTPPVLEIENKEEGGFRPLVEPMGFPPGLPRMISVDLTDQAPLASRRLRLRTNMRVFWDQIFIAEPLEDSVAADKIKVNEIKLSGAHLHRRGFPREHSPDGREPRVYDYGILDNTQPFKVMTGDYTKFGAVTELLTRSDDRFVIFGKGEEVTLEFPVKGLPVVPKGSTRSFLLYANGYCKDMDPHTAYPDTVEPLPFHGMSAYPYPSGESYPDDAEHRDYRKTWNTRRLDGR